MLSKKIEQCFFLLPKDYKVSFKQKEERKSRSLVNDTKTHSLLQKSPQNRSSSIYLFGKLPCFLENLSIYRYSSICKKSQNTEKHIPKQVQKTLFYRRIPRIFCQTSSSTKSISFGQHPK